MAKKKEAYLYLSAMLRAREPGLLNKEKAGHLLNTHVYEELAKHFLDYGYPDMSRMDASGVEKALAQRRAEIFHEIEKMVPDKELIDIFRLKYDYHNAKAIIKAEAAGQDVRSLLSDSGRIPGEQLLELYNEQKTLLLPKALYEAMNEAKTTLAQSGNPQLSDFVLDKAYFMELLGIAHRIDNGFIVGYIRTLVDSANLKSTVRSLRMGKKKEFLAELLVPEGSVSTLRILEEAEDANDLTELYANTKLKTAALLGAEALEGGRLTAFELACDNAVTAYLEDAKYIGYGPEIVLNYLAAVENEMTTVRMILTGSLAGVKPQQIRERLRDLNV